MPSLSNRLASSYGDIDFDDPTELSFKRALNQVEVSLDKLQRSHVREVQQTRRACTQISSRLSQRKIDAHRASSQNVSAEVLHTTNGDCVKDPKDGDKDTIALLNGSGQAFALAERKLSDDSVVDSNGHGPDGMGLSQNGMALTMGALFNCASGGNSSTPARSWMQDMDPIERAHINWTELVGGLIRTESSQLSVLDRRWVLDTPARIDNIWDTKFSNSESGGRRTSANRISGGFGQHGFPHTLLRAETRPSGESSMRVSTKLSNKARCIPMHPASKQRLIWDLLGSALCIYDVIAFPMLLAQLAAETTSVAAVLTCFWSLDMAVSCLTGHYDQDGSVERRIYFIMKRYLATWFAVDLVLVSLDVVTLIFGQSSTGTVRVLKSVFRVVRAVRILRIVRLYPKLQDQLGHINSERFFTVFRLMCYVALVVLANHYLACVWCSIWDTEDRHTYSDPSAMVSHHYLVAMHWSLAHSMLGSMDISANSSGERLFTCCVLIVSLVVFSTLLSTITNDTNKLRLLTEESSRKISVVRRFFSENSLPPELACNVWHFITKYRLNASARIRESTVEMFEMLPPYIVREIRYETYRPVLREHPLFAAYDEIEPEAIKMICNSGIAQLRVAPQEQIIFPTTQGVNRMLFVVRGCLEYHPIELPGKIFKIPPRSWACEEVLWARHPKLNGTLAAGCEPSEIVLVSPIDFRDVARIFPGTLRKLMLYGQKFVQLFNTKCKEFEDAESDPLFNESAMIDDIVDQTKFLTEPAIGMVLSASRHLAATRDLRKYGRAGVMVCTEDA